MVLPRGYGVRGRILGRLNVSVEASCITIGGRGKGFPLFVVWSGTSPGLLRRG